MFDLTEDVAINDILSAHEETHLEKLVRKERWRRLSRECQDSEEGDQNAEVLGVCHRPGCAVPETQCAKDCASAGSSRGGHRRSLPVAGLKGCDDSTQQSHGAVEIKRRVGRKLNRFVAPVVPGNSGLLLSRPDVKGLGAKINHLNDQLHLSNLDVTFESAG